MAFRSERPLVLVAAAAPPAKGAPAKPNPKTQALALAVVDRFVIPAYRALGVATQAQDEAWMAFKANRATGNFLSLRTAYNAACDAWAGAQLIKMGPMSLFLRADRFAYWPEARNVTQRSLDTLLKSNDPNDLSAETLAHDSVAAQGLTALERILYDGDPEGALKATGRDAIWRVTVGEGIAHNLAVIAREVVGEWTAPGGVRAMIAANKPWKTIFADASEAARLLLTDLVSGFKLMHDVKLLPVLGPNIDAAKPKSAEAWRSQRPQKDLKLNLASAQAMGKIFAEPIPASHRTKIDGLFAAAAKAVDAVPADMGEAAADPKRRPKVEAARVAIKAVQVELAKTLPADLGISLGFNLLDGD
jgi:predicted lipoprotein